MFVDSVSGETVFEVGTDDDGLPLISYHLYDSRGELVASSGGARRYPKGVTVRCSRGELLLEILPDDGKNVRYRLYNSEGQLLTWSDGVKTQIFGILRMEGNGRQWPNSRSQSAQGARTAK